jgi:hypothetical protein
MQKRYAKAYVVERKHETMAEVMQEANRLLTSYHSVLAVTPNSVILRDDDVNGVIERVVSA